MEKVGVTHSPSGDPHPRSQALRAAFLQLHTCATVHLALQFSPVILHLTSRMCAADHRSACHGRPMTHIQNASRKRIEVTRKVPVCFHRRMDFVTWTLQPKMHRAATDTA